MKAITWLAAFAAPAILVSSVSAKTLSGWSTDLEKAIAEAKQQNKSVLVEFTGSDWCPPCIAMRKNVFSKKDFVAKAAEKFVLVELDFPRGDKELAKKNEPYFIKYKVEGFPTVVLLTPEGKPFGKFIASDFPTTGEFLKHLDHALERSEMD
ncbi:MAG: thioredoxin family protein [Verrucomicrobiota bacterium]